MKKLFVIIAIIILFLIPSLDSIQANIKNDNQIITISSEKYEKGYRYNTHGWIYLYVEGEPYDRGYQHGYLLSEEIVDHIQRWMHIFPQKLSWRLQRINANRFFWKKYPKEYQQEIKGIADGCAARGGKIYGKPVSYKDILALNEMYEMLTRFRNGNIQPLRLKNNWFYNRITGIIRHILNVKTTDINTDSSRNKCSAFIATGDATVDGRIVASHNTRGLAFAEGWWHMYVTERWNLMIDINPTEGNRIFMSTAPGMIWSDEDYYQNDAGMILMETTLSPLGVWNRFGLPLVIRARKAIQYGSNIDDMVIFFVKRNNGLFANEWLIGDTKTGEIATLELALFNHALKRTYNGFYWSVNFPRDNKVRWELNSIFGFGIMGRILAKEYTPCQRDFKFEEEKDRYYGKIDVDIARKIMSTPPINDVLSNSSVITFDCKVTDTQLVKNYGLWAAMGNPAGVNFPAANFPISVKREEYTDSPGCGWIQLFGLDEQSYFREIEKEEQRGEYGEKIWEFQTDEGEIGNFIYSSPISDKEKLYVTSWNGKIYAIDIKNGLEIWKTNLGWGSESTPIVVDKKIIVGSSDGLFALDSESGEIIWKNEIRKVSTKPLYHDDKIYCGSHDGKFYAYDLETGEIEWTFVTDDEIHSSASIKGNILYFGSNDGYLYALDSTNGILEWKFKTEGAIWSSPFIYNNKLYFGSWDSNLYALDIQEGKLIWKFTSGWGIDCSPTICDDIVYFGSQDNNLYALNAENGNQEWVYQTNGGIKSSPTVYGNFVFFGSSDGNIYAINASNSNLEWKVAPDYHIEGTYNYLTKPIVSSPYLYDGRLFVGSTNGNVYCFNAKAYERSAESSDKDLKIPLETWLFMSLSILIIVLITGFYLYLSRRKNN